LPPPPRTTKRQGRRLTSVRTSTVICKPPRG
jgi:hypothetical protein